MPEQFNRRQFLGSSAAVTAAPFVTSGLFQNSSSEMWDPEKPMIATGKELKVLPVLVYNVYQRKEQSSWRSWGGVLTGEAADDEVKRIDGELKILTGSSEFPLTIVPVVKARNVEEAANVRSMNADVVIIYAASGGGDILETIVTPSRHNLIFVRHKSGPVYLWYEIAHCRFLRKGGRGFELNNYRYPGGMDVYDVVVDNYHDVLMRLRALYGLKNFLGSRIVALGGAGGWGCAEAPDLAREKFKIEIVDVSYEDLGKRITAANSDTQIMNQAQRMAERYLNQGGIHLNTEKVFVQNAFVLYKVIKDYMRDNDAPAFTIQGCMSTVMPISKTTACVPLSLLNDEGLLAFCESDFNVIPSGILLHYISGKPVFLNDPTYPHHGMVTVAHCTSPRRMDGKTYENTQVMTHFESDYGAAPKVNYRNGERITMIVPDSPQERWVGFKGQILDSPFMPICRSQCDVAIEGSCNQLLEEMRGFHWMMSYGDYLDEVGYAVRKSGLKWLGIS